MMGMIGLFSCSEDKKIASCENLGKKSEEFSFSNYENLKQINKDNVSELMLAWQFAMKDVARNKNSRIDALPIINKGIVYGVSPSNKIFALKLNNGELIWEFDPHKKAIKSISTSPIQTLYLVSNQDGGYILFILGEYLYRINASNGEPVERFGERGKVKLESSHFFRNTNIIQRSFSKGVLLDNILVVATTTKREGVEKTYGEVVAYDIRSGKVRWDFSLNFNITEPKIDSISLNYSFKPAEQWGGLSLDKERKWIYVAVGGIEKPFYGGQRPGTNLFANCVLALDLILGDKIWHYQTVVHDLWARDLPTSPILGKIEIKNTPNDVVIQPTNHGYTFILDRDTGEPTFPTTNRPVPLSGLKGEEVAPSQPSPNFPEPFTRQGLSQEEVKLSGNRHIFLPPSDEETIIFPSSSENGGRNGAAFDPVRQILFVNGNEIPRRLKLRPVNKTSQNSVVDAAGKFRQSCISCHDENNASHAQQVDMMTIAIENYTPNELISFIRKGHERIPNYQPVSNDDLREIIEYLIDPEIDNANFINSPLDTNIVEIPSVEYYTPFAKENDYPAIDPPWGTLNAINLKDGKLLWQVPLGEYEEFSQRGIPPTGIENYGKPLVTAGNLIFIAATKDEKIRAFDSKNGAMLWEYKLSTGGYTSALTTEFEGVQYVLVNCGGGRMGTEPGGNLYTFKLGQ